MAIPANNNISPQSPLNCWANFVQGTDTSGTYKTMRVAPANGDKIYGALAVTNSTTAVTASLRVTNVTAGTTVHLAPFVTQTVSVNAGSATGTISQALMTTTQMGGLAIDQNGNTFIPLQTGDTLEGTYTGTLSSAANLSIFATVASFATL